MRFFKAKQISTIALLFIFFIQPTASFAASTSGKGKDTSYSKPTSSTSQSDVKPLSNMDEYQAKALLKKIIHENPDLILDVLKNNSETVLEIAQQGNIQRRRKMLLAQWKADANVVKKVEVKGVPFRGTANAPVTIVEFSDYTCSYCRQTEVLIEELLAGHKENLVGRKNTIKILFKPLPKQDSPLSMAAAKFAQAALLQDQAKGWEFHKILFAESASLDNGGEDFLKSVATRVGLDYKKLYADASSKKVADIINKVSKEADELDVSGTPYFLVNNLIIRGMVPKDIFEEAIKQATALGK